ncbi:hypothetical protein DP42_4733 [Burkholderia pseudomallei]|nr:hypothetical protein DP42_4733 [Burkholderia pseudomallei]
MYPPYPPYPPFFIYVCAINKGDTGVYRKQGIRWIQVDTPLTWPKDAGNYKFAVRI